jgi:hypothetical protein
MEVVPVVPMSTETVFRYVVLEGIKHLAVFYCNYKHDSPFPEERYGFDKNQTFLIRYTEHTRNVTSIDWLHLFPIPLRRADNGWMQLFLLLEIPRNSADVPIGVEGELHQ